MTYEVTEETKAQLLALVGAGTYGVGPSVLAGASCQVVFCLIADGDDEALWPTAVLMNADLFAMLQEPDTIVQLELTDEDAGGDVPPLREDT